MSRYLEPLFRRWIEFVALLVVIPIVLVAGNLAFLRTHQASAALWVDNPAYLGAAASPPDWNPNLSPAQNETETMTQILKTKSFKESVAESLATAGIITTPQRGPLIASLSSGFKITADGTHLVSLSYSCDRDTLCVSVMTTTLDQYRQQLAGTQQFQAAVAVTFYTSQLATAQASLSNAQAALGSYVAQHPGTDATGNITVDKLQRDVTASRASINSLSDKLNQTQLTAAASQKVALFRIADRPALDTGSVLGAAETRRALLEAAVSWIVAIAYLGLLRWLDRTVRDARELERKIQAPVVVTIPHFADMRSV